MPLRRLRLRDTGRFQQGARQFLRLGRSQVIRIRVSPEALDSVVSLAVVGYSRPSGSAKRSTSTLTGCSAGTSSARAEPAAGTGR